jgi:hypothetical protein
MIKYRGQLYRLAATRPGRDEVLAKYALPSWEELLKVLLRERAVDREFFDTEVGEQRYLSAARRLDHLNGELCWRAIAVPANTAGNGPAIDPKYVDPIGVYWTTHPEKAIAYWQDASGESEVYFPLVYEAQVDLNKVNVLETVKMGVVNPGEFEVRFEKGVKIWVYNCTVWPDEWRVKGTEWKIPINDWRTV